MFYRTSLILFILCLVSGQSNFIWAASFTPDAPALLVEQFNNDTYLPHLNWVIEEGKIPLSPAQLSQNNLEDGLFINLEVDGDFDMKANNYYWFNIKFSDLDKIKNKTIHLFRAGNCWPWEITFYEVEAFQFQQNKFVQIGITGNSIPASKRDTKELLNPSILSLNKVVPESPIIWIRFKSVEACRLMMQMKLIDNVVTFSGKKIVSNTVINILILGAVFSILFLTILLYLKYKETLYLLFIFLLAIQLVHRIFIEFKNLLFQNFFAENPRLQILMTIIFATLNMVLMLHFWKVYIRAPEKYPTINKVIAGIIATIIATSIIGTTIRMTDLNFDFYFRIRQFIMLICFLTLVLTTIYLIFKGDQLARFISGGIALICIVTVTAIITINLSPNGNSTNFSQLTGIGFVSVMALAMIYRFYVVNAERQVALAEKIEIEKQNAVQLAKINEASNKFVPNAFLNALGKKNILQAALGDSKEQDVSILFSDIRNFTSISENLTPKEIFKFVSDFNKGIGPIITRNNGFINQYLGDGIMAIFPDNAQDALNAALEMKRYEQNTKHLAIRNFDIGIGIHYGSIMMGIMGDKDRLDAAIIADAVNLAARIESLTKDYSSSILFSGDFYEKLTMSSQNRIRKLGLVKIKGKALKVNLYQSLNYLEDEQIELIESTLPLFNNAINHLTQGKKREGLDLLREVLEINPKDYTSKAIIKVYRRAERAAMNEIINSLDRLK